MNLSRITKAFFRSEPKQALPRRANVAFYRDEMMLVGSMAGFIEVKATRAPGSLDNEQLGNLVDAALAEYDEKAPTFSVSGKKSDWPSYKASGLKTIKSFERGLIEVGVQRTSQETILRGIYYPNQELAVEMRMPRTIEPQRIGASIRRVHEAICALRSSNVV